jgi:acetolactate synthase-1/3 small subunit
MSNNRHTIAVWVENLPGMLSRVAGFISARGFNIESICAGPTTEPGITRITIVISGDPQILELILKQIRKQINVIKVINLSAGEHVEREMALVKVKAQERYRPEVLRIADIFRCRVVDVGVDTYTLEITGNHEKIEAVLELLDIHGVLEVARTGTCAIQRGKRAKGRTREGAVS